MCKTGQAAKDKSSGVEEEECSDEKAASCTVAVAILYSTGASPKARS